MAVQYSLTAQAKLVQGLAPAADAAGRSGAWVSLKGAHKAYVIFHTTQGNAATIALTFQQASDVSGTGAKALTGNMSIWANQDTATSDTLVAQTAAKTFTTSAAVKNKMVVFEIIPQTVLDVNNGFDCIQIITGSSNAANITFAGYVLTPLGYQQETPVSAVAD